MPYPAVLDNLQTNHVDPPAPGSPEKILAAHINAIADAINRIEQNLGLNPDGIFSDVVSRLNALQTVAFNNQNGTTYTLAAADEIKAVVMLAAGASTLTIPNNSAVPFQVGTEIRVRQGGAGQVTVVGATGVTVVNPFGSFVTAGQNAEVKLLKTGTNAWSLNGEVA